MPQFQAMVERANMAFNRENLANVRRELFAPGASLSEAARTMGIAGDDREEGFLRALQPAVKEGIRSAIYASITGSPPIPVQFLWMPAGHEEVRTASVPGSSKSIGGTSVLLHTPIPPES